VRRVRCGGICRVAIALCCLALLLSAAAWNIRWHCFLSVLSATARTTARCGHLATGYRALTSKIAYVSYMPRRVTQSNNSQFPLPLYILCLYLRSMVSRNIDSVF
jgi:hypothetical protein